MHGERFPSSARDQAPERVGPHESDAEAGSQHGDTWRLHEHLAKLVHGSQHFQGYVASLCGALLLIHLTSPLLMVTEVVSYA